MGDQIRRDMLRERIEAAYRISGNKLGWRLLYSPEAVLDGAEIAFIGLNPGGREKPADHAEFCMERGSAYAREGWAGHAPAESPLQRQVLLLFKKLGVRREDVLAGNLVPFKSPDWTRLSNSAQALSFGRALWRDILHQVAPKLVVSMGEVTNEAVAGLPGVRRLTFVRVNWGNVSASEATFDRGKFIGLPHLSRFGIVSRPESLSPLRNVFGDYWLG